LTSTQRQQTWIIIFVTFLLVRLGSLVSLLGVSSNNSGRDVVVVVVGVLAVDVRCVQLRLGRACLLLCLPVVSLVSLLSSFLSALPTSLHTARV
jgi:hypothetical protein